MLSTWDCKCDRNLKKKSNKNLVSLYGRPSFQLVNWQCYLSLEKAMSKYIGVYKNILDTLYTHSHKEIKWLDDKFYKEVFL